MKVAELAWQIAHLIPDCTFKDLSSREIRRLQQILLFKVFYNKSVGSDHLGFCKKNLKTYDHNIGDEGGNINTKMVQSCARLSCLADSIGLFAGTYCDGCAGHEKTDRT